MRGSTHQGTGARTEPGERPETLRSSRREHRRRRLYALVALCAVVTAAGLSALSLIGAMRAVGDDVALGRSAAEHARSALLTGDADAAAASFRHARERFVQAEERTNGLVFRAISWLPILGRTTDAVHAVAESAVTAASAMNVLTDAVAGLPGGMAGLAPTRGVIPIERIPPLARAAREADRLIAGAVSGLEEAPDSLLIGPVGPSLRGAEEELGELADAIHSASLVLQGLPNFLGAERAQRYFFGAQNPAELRGTGGLIGAYAILTIDGGRFRFSAFVPIHSLGQPPLKSIPPPNEDYATNYDRFRRGGRFWTSINVMPDLPSVAGSILNSYEAVTGERLDGVILADPFALAALLAATGPVELPGYGVEIDADNVVPFTTNDAYSLFTDPTRRKRVLGDVARVAFERFVARSSAGREDLGKLLEAAGGQHLQIYSEDPALQEGLRATPAGGTLRPARAEGDVLAVVVNSAAGSKVDFYQERDVRYSVLLHEDGSAVADVALSLRNDAPTSGQPRYVIGPFRPVRDEDAGPILRTLEAGESVALVNVYCGEDCIPIGARLDGAPIPVAPRVDLGMRYVQHYFSIRSGEEETLRLSWDDPQAWDGNSSGGVYRLTFVNQVTIRPASVAVHVKPPRGMRVVSVSSPLTIIDGAAVYEGEPGPRLDIDIEFRPSLPVRLWRNVTRFLNTPLFEF